MKEQPNYSTIIHSARQRLELTPMQFCVADSINKLSQSPKYNYTCKASKKKLADFLCTSRRTIINCVNKLEELGLIERVNNGNDLKTTDKWYQEVIVGREESSQGSEDVSREGVKKLHGGCEDVSHPSNKETNKEINTKESVATEVDDDYPESCEFIDEAAAIAEILLDHICKWDPTHRYNQKTKVPKSWILSIERAMRIDGRTQEQLEYLIEFIFTQSNCIATFWAGNVQSGKKLREQFDQIKNQIKNSKQNVKHREIQSTVDSLYG